MVLNSLVCPLIAFFTYFLILFPEDSVTCFKCFYQTAIQCLLSNSFYRFSTYSDYYKKIIQHELSWYEKAKLRHWYIVIVLLSSSRKCGRSGACIDVHKKRTKGFWTHNNRTKDLKARLNDNNWNGPTRDVSTHIDGATPICMYTCKLIRYNSSYLHNWHWYIFYTILSIIMNCKLTSDLLYRK